MPVGGECLLGMPLTTSADEAHLQEAYGQFAAEARDVDPGYTPQTAGTDGWAATQNAFGALFSTIVSVLCYLHGFLKIRDRCRQARELHQRICDVYRAATAEEFRRRMMGGRGSRRAETVWTSVVIAAQQELRPPQASACNRTRRPVQSLKNHGTGRESEPLSDADVSIW